MRKIYLVIILLFAFSKAEAKIFDFKNASYGAFVGGTYGPSQASDMAYGGSSGDKVNFDQKEQSNYSAEFGFIASHQKVNFKLYAEYLFPKHLTNVTGSNASGTSVYNLDTQVTALIPTAALEYAIKSGNTWRWLVAGGYGYAMANMANKYTFTSAGQSYGLSNFEEDATATSSMYMGYTSLEFQFTEIGTMMLSAGYRYLRLNNWTNSSPVTGFNGSEASGATLTNQDGSNRSVNLSGPYAGVSFRFYFY